MRSSRRRHFGVTFSTASLAAVLLTGCGPRGAAPQPRSDTHGAEVETAPDPLAAEMQAQAELFIQTMRLRRQLDRLDYDPESLRAIDKWLQANYGSQTQRFIDMPSRSAMAYVGEVIRRHMRGKWVPDKQEELEARLGGSKIGRVAVRDQVVDPAEWVYDAILEKQPLYTRWRQLSTQ